MVRGSKVRQVQAHQSGHKSLPLRVEVVHRRVLAFRRRVRQRSVAEIHAVSVITRECRRQEGRIHVAESNAVGRAKAAVDGHAHDGGACSAPVERKADDVPNSTSAAKAVLSRALVMLLQPNAVHSPRPRAIAPAPSPSASLRGSNSVQKPTCKSPIRSITCSSK